MEYTILGNNEYTIDQDLNIKRTDKKPLDLVETKDTVSITLYRQSYNTGYTKTVDKSWLFWLAYLEIEFPRGYEHYVWELDFKRHGMIKVHSKYPVVPVFKSPIYVHGDKGLRLIPRFPKYAINKNGDILNLDTGFYRKYNKNRISKNLYPHIGINGISTILHRLVALTWVENDDFIVKPIVDHKDEDKTNCNADNLQWLSYRDNIAKTTGFDKSIGMSTGSRFQKGNIPKTGNLHDVYTRSIDTGKVTKHDSLAEVVRFIGRSRINTVHTPIKKGFVWKGKNGMFEISYDKNDWVYVDKKPKNPRSKITIVVKDTITNEERIYDSSIDFHKCELGRNKDSTTGMKNAIRILNDKHPHLKVTYNRHLTNSKVQAYNLQTKEVLVANTHKELAKMLGVGKSTVQKYIKLNNGTVLNGYMLRPYSEEPWGEPINA